MILTSSQNRSKRLQICRECPHYKSITKSCGTIGFGETIYEGKDSVKLCGCIMPIKAGLKTASCPISKWEADVTRAELKQIKKLIEGITGNRITGEQNHELTKLWNKAAGRNRKPTTCTSCIKDMIKDLKKLTNE